MPLYPPPALTNPMTTGGDIIYGSGGGTPARLANGSVGQTLTSAGGTSAPSWAFPAYRSVTTTDAPTNSDSTLNCSGASFTITLPTAVGFAGKTFRIVHSGTSFTQLYTLNTTSAQTIGGVASGSYVLYTNGESLTIQSDGANWIILDHFTETGWFSGTITITGSGSPAKGTTQIDFFKFKRSGSLMQWEFAFSQSVGGSAGTSGDYLITLPNSQLFDSNVVSYNASAGPNAVPIGAVMMGFGNISAWKAAATESGQAVPYDSSHFRIWYDQANATWCQNGAFSLNIVQNQIGSGFFPIAGWQP